MTLSENIKNRRETLKLSQEYVANQLGVSRQAVSKWESGQSEPSANNLIQLAKILEISLSELVDPPQNKENQPIFEKAHERKKPNSILRTNLTTLAIITQAAWMFSCTQIFYQLHHSNPSDKNLYSGALIVNLLLLLLSSIWMATNHRYEADENQRRKNTKIELGYCCIQFLACLLIIRFELGLVGAALIIAIGLVYILYINPKFMARKLTK